MSFVGRQFKGYQLQDGSGPQDVSALAIAPHGPVWCASAEGRLFRQSGGTLQAVAANLPHNDVQAMLFDRDGNLWMGFPNRGLARLHDGKLDLLDSHNGLHGQTVEALFEDAEHNLWVGTFDGGLVQLRDGKFKVY